MSLLKMKPTPQHFIAAVLLLFCTFQVSAQTPIEVTFTPQIATVALGANVAIQVKVVNFKNIGSIQFPITFNQNVLELVSVTAPNAAFGNAPPFNTTLTLDPSGNNVFLNPGRLAVSWQSNPNNQPNGITIAANGSLFTLNFKALTNGVATINMAGAPAQPNLEITTATGLPVTVNYQNGGSTVTSGSGGVTPPVTTIQGLHVIANTIHIPQGEIGCMPFTANDFEGIQSILYAMNWNAPTLELVATRNNGLPGIIDFGINNAIGRIGTLWGTPSGTPVSRPDLSTLYEVCFRAEGAAGSSTLVTPNGNGFPGGTNPEIVNAVGANLWKDTTGIGDTIFIVPNPAPAYAVNYTAENDTVNTGLNTCVAVKFKNFSNASYGEFAMTYDTTKLKFAAISLGANLLGLSLADTATNNYVKFFSKDVLNANGVDTDTLRYIHFAYRKSAGAGVVADNAVPFSVCFKAIGPASPTATPVKIGSFFDLGNALVPIGAAKKTFGSVPVAAVAGSVLIRSASTLSATATTTQNVSCAGGSNGAITLAVNSCNGNATYNWAGPGINASNIALQNQTSLTQGTYAVTVTCGAGGTTTATATVTAPPAINLPVPTMTAVTCNGGSDGSITIAPIGGTGGYTYVWTGPAGYASTVQNPTGLKFGTIYKVTITDNSGCPFVSSTLTVPQPAAISIATVSMTMIAVKCKGGSDGAITIPDATGGNAGAYSYAWTGPGGFTASTKNISGLKAGSYSVVVTDSKGCPFTIPTPLQVNEPAALPAVADAAPTQVKCFGGNDGAIQINVTGGTTQYTYSWKNTATGTLVSTSEDPTGLAAGTYAVTVTDANLCTATSNPVTINAPSAALTVTETHVDAACANSSTGSIALNISGGWNNPTVAWSPALPPVPNPTNILPGAYTATVTDAGGCTVTISATVNSAPALSLGDFITTNVACFGQATGGIVIFPSGGGTGTYDVSWTGGLSGTAIGNLAGGNYVPTVTNQGTGCTAVFAAITITEPPPIVVVPTVTGQTGGTNNGKIELSVTGGTPTYGYSWTGPGGFTSTQSTIDNLAPGNYTITIADANGCAFTSTYTVSGGNVLSAITGQIKNACNNDGCIEVIINANATATPFVLSWGGGTPTVSSDHTVSVCSLAPGLYNITITDNAGNTAVLGTQTIAQAAPATVGNAIVEPFDEAKNGSIILSPVPAGAPLTYLWDHGSTSSALVNLDSGTYVVTVTHVLSQCTSVYSYHLNRKYQPPVPTFTALTNVTCANSLTGAISFSFSGANGPNYTYAWSGPGGYTANTKNLSGLAAGTYTVTVTDETPSTFTYTTTLTTQSQLAVTNVNETSLYAGGFQVTGNTPCDGKATVSFSGQFGTASILWSNGVTIASNTTLCGGAYQVTVTDQLGCFSVWSDSLTAPEGVKGNTTIVAPVSCNGECDGIAQLYVTGGVAPYTVRWALPGNQFQQDQLLNSSSFSVVDNLCGGDYKVTITDSNGSTRLENVTMTEPASITASFNQNPPTRFNSCDAETMITAIGVNGIPTYSWSGSNSHSGTEARADGLCAGEVVTFVIVDDKGCSAIAQDTIGYPEDGCLLGSPVITPGEKDGKNDELYITCAETLNNTVEIFNRWGQMVFSVQNYDNNGIVWSGETKNGAALPDGVYFYVMTYTDDQGAQQRIKGYVNLLR